jgi:hypothetical protein
MNKQLRRLLDLARRTGDRIIVTDPEGEETFVLMGLDQYESLLVARGTLSSLQHVKPLQPPSHPSDIFEAMPAAGSPAETWDLGKLNPQEQTDLEAQYQAYLKEKEQKDGKEAKSQKKSEEFGEEQFYLEPIE